MDVTFGAGSGHGPHQSDTRVGKSYTSVGLFFFFPPENPKNEFEDFYEFL